MAFDDYVSWRFVMTFVHGRFVALHYMTFVH